MNIKQLGAASWGFRETPLEEKLMICNRLGLSYLEVSIANEEDDISLDVDEEMLIEVKQMYKKYGISHDLASTGNDFTLSDEEEVDNQVIKIKKVIDICVHLEVKCLRIFAGFSPVEEVIGQRLRIMIQAITQVADYAKQKGVTLAIETHGGVNAFEDGVEHYMSVSTHSDMLKKLMEEIPKDIKFVFDPANLYAVGISQPEEIFRILKERIAYLHMKDFASLPSGHVRPGVCGDSDMDWNLLMMCLKDYKGPVLIEYENTIDVEDGFNQCIKFLKQYL